VQEFVMQKKFRQKLNFKSKLQTTKNRDRKMIEHLLPSFNTLLGNSQKLRLLTSTISY